MDLETYRMLQDPNFSLIVIWGMVCITAVTVTTIAYFFSMLNNLFFHYSKKKDKIIEELSFTPTGKPGQGKPHKL